MQGEQFQVADLVENLNCPATGLCRNLDFIQYDTNINCFAVVTTMVFSKFLHAENFTQRREDARKF